MAGADPVAAVAKQVSEAATWDQRVALIRQVPEKFGRAQHREVYAQIAREVYVPSLAPNFAYLHWRPDYELEDFQAAYDLASAGTKGFTQVDAATIAAVLATHPATLVVFRNIVGYSRSELSGATGVLPADLGLEKVTGTRLRSMEEGRTQPDEVNRAVAETIVRLVDGRLFPAIPDSPTRRKQAKPDTKEGWKTVAHLAKHGVPHAVLLHQRHYGGAFRQLLDATSTRRGDVLEDAVEELFKEHGVPYVRTGSHNQAEIAKRFGLTVQPAPDFVLHDNKDTLRAMLEAKGANDGGTARDKASRFATLRREAARLGGVPVFAALEGLGWDRVSDALGPVVEACDGRVFTPATLDEMLSVAPLPSLQGMADTEAT